MTTAAALFVCLPDAYTSGPCSADMLKTKEQTTDKADKPLLLSEF